jgi:conserved hypothetical phage tail region protein
MANTQWPKNPQRLTPYPNFRFKVKWDNQYVAGISKVSALSRTTEVIRHREGGDPSTVHLAPGQTSYGPITLERGVSYDVTFEQWANKVFDWTNSQSSVGQNTSLLDFRKNIIIELYNEAGVKVMAYNVYNAWVSEYEAMSELDASGNAFVIQSMTLQNEGWERDTSVTEQKEPSFTLPAS